MNFVIEPSPNLHGTVQLPSNKSQSFRSLIFAALAEGTSRISHPAISNDWTLAEEALDMFGAVIEPHADNVWEVNGVGGALKTPDDVLQCGNSGIIMRFFTALAACCDGCTVLTGDDSLRHIRPLQPLIDAINQLGGEAISTKGDGMAPVVIRGPLTGGCAEFPGQDSQHVSGALIAAALTPGATELHIQNPGEKPWVDMTLAWLVKCGVAFTREDYDVYRVCGGKGWSGFDYAVPKDISALMYPVAAALMTPDSELRMPGVDLDDPQGDKLLLDVLRDMGGDITTEGDTVIARSSTLVGREIDCNNFIDQLPILALVGTQAEGETRLVNAAICREKECDRIAAMAQTLAAMGADIQETADGLIIRQSRLKGASLSSYHDHRMVMTLSVAGLLAEGQTVISECECVRKTFPHFQQAFQNIGALIRKTS